MPWIEDDEKLHHCSFPQWQPGEKVRSSYSLWACDLCGRVYTLIVGQSRGANETKWRPSYGWTLAKDLVYVSGKVVEHEHN